MEHKQPQAGDGSRLRKAHPQGVAFTQRQTRLDSINHKQEAETLEKWWKMLPLDQCETNILWQQYAVEKLKHL